MFNKVFFQLISVTVFTCVLLAFVGLPALAAESSAYAIIRDIINDYGCQGGDAADAIDSLFTQLEEIDPDAASAWHTIYDYWQYANNEMTINTDAVPQGLPEDNSLCIVVLGYGLMPDGTMKPELEGRLTVALKCAERYPNAFILCTGGGTASENESATEAGMMADRLIEYGIEADRIITEDRSLTTGQNAIYSYAILSDSYPQIDSLIIVSSDYHIPWGTVMFQSQCLLGNERNAGAKLTVIANAAYAAGHAPCDYRMSQAAGLLEILEATQAADAAVGGTVG